MIGHFGRPQHAGQALVELALVLPIVLIVGCGAVAVVQLARTQMTMESAAAAAALVAARGVDATEACSSGHRELQTVLAESGGLVPTTIEDEMHGGCAGALPNSQTMPTSLGGGSFALWFGYGGADDTFCRVGTVATSSIPTDGDVMATVVFRPNLSWIPLVGGMLSPRLVSAATDKVNPFRSRKPSTDPTGDNC